VARGKCLLGGHVYDENERFALVFGEFVIITLPVAYPPLRGSFTDCDRREMDRVKWLFVFTAFACSPQI
jgi:hypothetical protein